MRKILFLLLILMFISLLTLAAAQNADMLYAEANDPRKIGEKVTAAELGNGEEIFNTYCKVCHVNICSDKSLISPERYLKKEVL